MKDWIGELFIVTLIIGGVLGIWACHSTHDRIFNADKKPSPAPDVIRTAAERNGIVYGSEDWFILLAIRKAEQGEPGLEFGIMSPEADNLDKQAGWCAASIVKSRARWVEAGKPEDFITFMGRRYCPPQDHPLNANWVGNVKYWADRLETE